jgi:hypothetical protein
MLLVGCESACASRTNPLDIESLRKSRNFLPLGHALKVIPRKRRQGDRHQIFDRLNSPEVSQAT